MSKIKKARIRTYLVGQGDGSNKMVHDIIHEGMVVATYEGPQNALTAKRACKELNMRLEAAAHG